MSVFSVRGSFPPVTLHAENPVSVAPPGKLHVPETSRLTCLAYNRFEVALNTGRLTLPIAERCDWWPASTVLGEAPIEDAKPHSERALALLASRGRMIPACSAPVSSTSQRDRYLVALATGNR